MTYVSCFIQIAPISAPLPVPLITHTKPQISESKRCMYEIRNPLCRAEKLQNQQLVHTLGWLLSITLGKKLAHLYSLTCIFVWLLDVSLICYGRFSELYLFVWKQLPVNQRPQLFVQSQQPHILILVGENKSINPNIWLKWIDIWIQQKT